MVAATYGVLEKVFKVVDGSANCQQDDAAHPDLRLFHLDISHFAPDLPRGVDDRLLLLDNPQHHGNAAECEFC